MIEGGAKESPRRTGLAAMKFAHAAVRQADRRAARTAPALGLPDKSSKTSPSTRCSTARAKSPAPTLAEALQIAGKLERQTRSPRDQGRPARRDAGRNSPEMTEEEFFRCSTRSRFRGPPQRAGHGKRIDGRAVRRAAPLRPRSACCRAPTARPLFNRGETQALATVTLGTKLKDAQSMDAITGGPDEEAASCCTTTSRPTAWARSAAWAPPAAAKSDTATWPNARSCRDPGRTIPYTVRVVSEIMGSNGSSSMASVCAGTLALMDAGVPIRQAGGRHLDRPVLGAGKAELVTDILGAEDHCGDMDFKVAGTREGITGFQVDLKIRGLRWDLVEGAFEMARKAACRSSIHASRSRRAARRAVAVRAAHRVKIPVDKIGALIGPGGKNIRRITDTFRRADRHRGRRHVKIFSNDKDAMDAAVREVEAG
jgi:polyribonucleotide nucleotidyltransferase